MSSLLSAELSATCSALGCIDKRTNTYHTDENTLETVKDLIRYLRRDDESHDIRRQLGDTKVLQTDLLPLMKSCSEKGDLFDVVLRLIVNLTTPALMLWNEQVPTTLTSRNHYLQIEDHLHSYKEAFADEGIWEVLVTRLSKILDINYAERGDENSLIIERILILIRNIMYVPTDPDTEKRTDNDANVHDQVLWALHQSGLMDLLVYMTSSPNEQAYHMHILEILSFMLREQKPSELASAALQRSQTEKLRDEAELLSIRNRENIQKRQKVRAYTGTRHSRFGGTYVVQSMKSISDNDLIYHRALNKLDELNFDVDKRKPKIPKNKLPVVETTLERRSALSIRLFLKDFCVEILNGSYNTLMYHVKDNLARGKAQQHDESYYLWALRFFMEFNRHYKFEVKLVSETMSVQTFHFVQQQSENFYDLMATDKKKCRIWSKRLHLALLAYKELFMTLNTMDKSSDSSVRSSASVIKGNIFYVMEYREFILTLLINYDEIKMSDTYLKDLLETQHIFIKMLEQFCGKEGTVMVQKKGRAKKQNRKSHKSQAPTVSQIDWNSKWDAVASQISTILEGATEFSTDVIPFDAASDVPIDDQKADTMKTIQRKLRDGDFENAIGLLRASREVWPENDSFGSPTMSSEEEFLAIRDIFLTDLGENSVDVPQADEFSDEEDDEEEEEEVQRAEGDFKFIEFIRRLCHIKIIRACGLCLKNFEKNSINTNHCTIKLLHRIAFDCKMYVMVFQVSIFKTFQKIYKSKDVPEFKELVKFATYIMRQFFKVAETNNKVYMESLFWKSSRTAYDIENGYGSYQEKSGAASRAWSEEEEDELRRLFSEHQHDHQDEDVVDWICNNLIDNTKTRRMVMKKLKEMYLLVNYKPGKKGTRPKIPQNWGAEEESELRELYYQLKDAIDPLTLIMDRLTVKRPKNRIIEKLLVMGLIQDKKEMRKKRPKKSGNKSKSDGRNKDDESGSGSDSSDDDSNTHASIVVPQKKRAPSKISAPRISAADLAKQLIEIVDNGMTDALEWLKESFTDAIEDIEDGSDEGIPIVPIMEYATTAMEDPAFQRLLKSFGVTEPFDEQEAYWRIPGDIGTEKLKSHCDILQQALDKTLEIPTAAPEEPVNIQSSDDEDVFERIKKTVMENKLKEDVKARGDVNKSDDEDLFDQVRNSIIENRLKEKIKNSSRKSKIGEILNEDNAGPSFVRGHISSGCYDESSNSQKSSKTKIRLEDSDDSDIESSSSRIKQNSPKTRLEDSDNSDNESSSSRMKQKSPKRKIIRLKDSDDSDNERESGPLEQDNGPNTSRHGRIESDDEDDRGHVTQAKKVSKILDSDSEDDVNKENLDTSNSQNEGHLKRNRSTTSLDSSEIPQPKRSRIIDSDDD